jgi:hypothetical protein
VDRSLHKRWELAGGELDRVDVSGRVGRAIEDSDVGSALAAFRICWSRASAPTSVPRRLSMLAEFACADKLVEFERLLGADDANTISVPVEILPGTVMRRPKSCVLLDAAVGAGAIEIVKCLLEFHDAKPSRDTLKMAISTGILELIRLIWQRLPEADLQERADLASVAADFHHGEVFAWLFRDGTALQSELVLEFVLKRRLADALLLAIDGGIRPWSLLCRAIAGDWPVAKARLRALFVPGTGCLSAASGWLLSTTGSCAAIPPCREVSRQSGFDVMLCEVVIPPDAAVIRERAFEGCSALVRVTMPMGETEVGGYAFYGCVALRCIHLGPRMTKLGPFAFAGCSGLTRLDIPSSVTAVGDWAFDGCSGLALTFSGSVNEIGDWAFSGCASVSGLYSGVPDLAVAGVDADRARQARIRADAGDSVDQNNYACYLQQGHGVTKTRTRQIHGRPGRGSCIVELRRILHPGPWCETGS